MVVWLFARQRSEAEANKHTHTNTFYNNMAPDTDKYILTNRSSRRPSVNTQAGHPFEQTQTRHVTETLIQTEDRIIIYIYKPKYIK